jgi:hypothetical protein
MKKQMNSLEKKLCQAECKLIEQDKKIIKNYTLIKSLESEEKRSSAKLPNEADVKLSKEKNKTIENTFNKEIMPTKPPTIIKNDELKKDKERCTTLVMQHHGITEDGNEQHARNEVKETEEELQDQNRRKTNIVIFQLAESDDDKTNCQNLFKEYCQINAEITSNYRMGDYKNGMRPVKISFSSQEERNNVMREFKYSQMISNHTSNIRKLILMDDLTPKQRNSLRELVKEKKRLREEQPGRKWIIRNWKIIAKN